MAKIYFKDEDKLSQVNAETLKLWHKYEIDMSLRELRDSTKSGYQNDIEHFWIYLYDNYNNIPITDVTSEIIEDFLYYCKTQGNNSRRIKRRLSTISAFYLFLRKKKLIKENPMDFIDRAKKDVDVVKQTFLTEDQIEMMCNKLEEKFNESETVTQKHLWLMLLAYAMFSLSTMARVNAVSSIQWNQVSFDDRIVYDVEEKEGYVVKLFFSNKVKELLMRLKDFRSENAIDDAGFVFIKTKSGGTNSVVNSTMHQWCKRIGALINVPTLHPHDFRHSGSQIMKKHGAPIEEISTALNHKGIEVTRKHYLQADQDQVREVRDRYGI